MSSERIYTVALIGLGMVSGTYLEALANSRQPIKLKGVLSSQENTAQLFLEKQFSTTLQRPCIYPNVEAIAADPDIDFVIITTPPEAGRGT